MLWVEMQNQSGILAAKWQRSAALSDDGIVFAPAAIAGDEQKVFYAAMWEAIPVVTEYGHSHVPTNWMVREYPDTLEVCTLIESKVRGAATNAEPEACESPRPSTHGPLRKAEQDTDHTPGQQSPRMSPHESPPKTIQVDPRLAEEVPFSGKLTEGALCRVTVNAYERNPIARANCIAHYGPTCAVCGFNFGGVYGPLAEGFIHVHHVKPLSEIGEQYEVDPVADLRPVCPNCHAVIHLGGACRSIEEVKRLLEVGAKPNPHKVLAVKRKYFPRPRGFWRFSDAFAPGSWQRRRRPSVGDPAWLSRADATPGPQAKDEPHPTRMRTPAAPLRGARRLCRGTSPGRSRYSFVPGVVAIRKAAGSSPPRERPVRQGSRPGRVVRRFPPVGSRGSAGVGWTWDGASAPSPYCVRRPRADLVASPDPPPHRGPVVDRRGRKKRARPASHQSVGLSGLRPRTCRSGLVVQ